MSSTARTFVAVFPPESVLSALRELQDSLEPSLPGLRWVKAENLHYTLRFFGDLDEDAVGKVSAAVDTVAAATVPFELEVTHVGVFPSWKRPRILWVGTGQGSAILEALSRTLERSFGAVGFENADKLFVPHLTLGRWRDVEGVDLVGAEHACAVVRQVTKFEVPEIKVIRSRLGAGGSTYTPVHTARFQ